MTTTNQQVFIIDDDEAVRDAMSMLLDTVDMPHQCFCSATEFLESYRESHRGCLVLDIRMPNINGLELQQEMSKRGICLPIIFITGHGDVPMAVEAMRRGALDFMRKPIKEEALLRRIQEALNCDDQQQSVRQDRENLQTLIDTLTPREFEVFQRVADGQANKVVSAELGISERTVEVYRYQMMKKLDANTLADLVKIKIQMQKLAIAT